MTTKPKILFFDVETSPVLAWIWRTGNKIRIGHEQIQKDQKFNIICVCWKWAGERDVHSLDFGIHRQDSEKLIEEFTKVIQKADLCISHNGDSFDVKQINTQRLLHNQAPIGWPTSEDTLKQFRKHFAFPSYKLDYLAKTLVGAGKGEMHFQDWIDIIEGKSQKALDKMIRYCKKDVRLLESIFNKASSHFTPKIHASVVCNDNRTGCPRCGSTKFIKGGSKLRMGGRFQRYQCSKCCSWFLGSRIAG